jgi:hypothetical protein
LTRADLSSYSPDKFAVLCDEALGPRLQYPHLPAHTAAAAAAAAATHPAAATATKDAAAAELAERGRTWENGDRHAGHKMLLQAPSCSDVKENMPNGTTANMPNGTTARS